MKQITQFSLEGESQPLISSVKNHVQIACAQLTH